MANPWFRMYVDFLDDPKMISLAFEDQRHFVGLLALKCSGVLDQSAVPETIGRVVAQRLWIDHAVISDVKKRLVQAGLIDDFWQPLAWDKRQRKSDVDWTRAERQQRFRDKNALCNATVTPPDKIRREENIKEDKEASALPEGFAVFWDTYPKGKFKVSKSKCLEIWKRKKLESKLDEILAYLENAKVDWLKDDNKYVPHTTTFLNQQRWDGWEPIEVNRWVNK